MFIIIMNRINKTKQNNDSRDTQTSQVMEDNTLTSKCVKRSTSTAHDRSAECLRNLNSDLAASLLVSLQLTHPSLARVVGYCSRGSDAFNRNEGGDLHS